MKKNEVADYDPKCPHCDTEFDHLMVHQSSTKLLGVSIGGVIAIYSCPHCKKALGLANVTTGIS